MTNVMISSKEKFLCFLKIKKTAINNIAVRVH